MEAGDYSHIWALDSSGKYLVKSLSSILGYGPALFEG